MSTVEVTRGDSPLVLGFPHTGTDRARRHLRAAERQRPALADTDWHIDRLYDGPAAGGHDGAHASSTATSSTPTATRRAQASIPARTPPACAR